MVKRKGARDERDNKRLNLILVLAIAAVACVGLVATRLMGANTNADTATVVIRDGKQNVYELPLNQNTTKTVTTDLGTNLIEIKDGRVHVEEADCPNQDCVHQGWVDAAGEQIVCLPHKHTVDIVDESAKATYDVVGR
ncbi:MAG: NusG domain II-containing protein [Collinsella sp.]